MARDEVQHARHRRGVDQRQLAAGDLARAPRVLRGAPVGRVLRRADLFALLLLRGGGPARQQAGERGGGNGGQYLSHAKAPFLAALPNGERLPPLPVPEARATSPPERLRTAATAGGG
jgi:hypothetical protein